MLGVIFAAAAAASPGLPPVPAVAAKALIERDWVLANWALKRFDADHDIALSPAEASAAAAAFKSIADSDGDGRITPIEYRQARDFILARY